MNKVSLMSQEKQCEHSRQHVAIENGRRVEGWEPMCHPCALIAVATLRAIAGSLVAALEEYTSACGNCDGSGVYRAARCPDCEDARAEIAKARKAMGEP